MDIDEAIKREEELADCNKQIVDKFPEAYPSNIKKCKEDSEEHRQMAEWLKELKTARIRLQYIENTDPEIATKSEIAAMVIQSPEMTAIAGKITQAFNATVNLVNEVMEAAGNAMAHLVESQIEKEEEEE